MAAGNDAADVRLGDPDQMLQALADHTPGAIVIKDMDGCFLIANETFCAWYGTSRENIVGKSMYEFLSKEDAERISAQERDVCETGAVSEEERRVAYPDGVTRDVFVKKFPITAPGGMCAAIGTVITDITKRKRAEEALRNSEEKIRAVVDHSPVNILLKDTEGRYLIVNKQWEEWIGAGAGDVIGKTAHEILPKDLADDFTADDLRVLETLRPIEQEQRLHYPDGVTRDVLVQKFPVMGKDGQPLAIGATISDITERKEAEERNALLATFLEHAPEAIEVTNTDYEIQFVNPALEAITGYSKSDAIGKTPEALHRPKEHDPKFYTGMETTLTRGRVWKGELVSRKKDGGAWHTEATIAPVRDASGEITHFMSIKRDITERKRAERNLRESEERFRSLVESTNVIAWEVDLETWRFTYVSPHAVELLGYPLEEWCEDGFWVDHIHPDDREKTVRYCTTATERGEDHDFEYRMISADGRVVWLRDIVTVVKDGDAPKALRGFMIDITKRKQAEEALRDSEEKFRALVDNSPAAIVFKDTEGRYLIANRQWETWFKQKDGAAIGKTTYDFFSREFGDAVTAHDNRVLEGLAPEEREYEVTHPDGVSRDVLSQKFPIIGTDGRPLGVGTIVTDITERKRAEDALRQAKETAEYANRAKTEFLANMSHELRTPLNSIIGFSDLLKDGVFGPVGNPKYEEYAEDINKSGIHLLELISDILDISKIEIGEMDLSEESVDIGETVKTCMMMVRERSLRAKVSLTSEIPDGLPRLQADQRRVKQILLNLLTNAIKFTPAEGSVVLEAGLDEGGGIVLEIRDTGVGIASEKISEVLEPFGQGGDVMTRGHEGTGLGLSLARSLAEMHGGALSIDSRLGKGTTVTVSFPGHRTVASG